MLTCEECQKTFNKLNGLLTHMMRSHGISSKQFYDKSVKKVNEGECKCCGAETIFKDFTRGYQQCCSNVCSGVVKAATLKGSGKFEKFVERVRTNTVAMHGSFSTERKSEISNKRMRTLAEMRFYENHSKTMKDWWVNADEHTRRGILDQTICKKRSKEEVTKIRKKAVETRVQNGNAIDRSSLADLNNYRVIVNRLTNKIYKNHIDEIDPNRLRDRTNFHIDHKVSILEGFLNNVSPEIISHKNNLRLIPAKQNISKSWRSSITLEELIGSING